MSVRAWVDAGACLWVRVRVCVCYLLQTHSCFFRARRCDLCTCARVWLRVYVLVCFLRSDLRGVRFVRLLARMFV